MTLVACDLVLDGLDVVGSAQTCPRALVSLRPGNSRVHLPAIIWCVAAILDAGFRRDPTSPVAD